MIRLLAILLLLASPAAAQEDMPHPETGKPGAWIPRELQQDHLLLEKKLEICDKVKVNQQQTIDKKDEEIQNRISALDAEKQASRAVTEVLTATNLELQEEQKQNNKLSKWLWGTSTAAVVATVALVLVVAL
jgi:hypothetical protein